MDDDDANLQRLRHAAFSRDATGEDLRRLAEHEAHLATTPRGTVAQREDVQDVDVHPGAEEVEVDLAQEPRRPLSRRRLGLTLGATAVGGALIGALTAVLIAVLVTGTAAPVEEVSGNWSGTSSLAVFDRDPTSFDDPGDRLDVVDHLLATMPEGPTPGLPEIDVRWIGAPGGFATYSVRSESSYASTVCVVVTSSLDEISECVPQGDFADEGIRIMAFGLDLRWGPTGAEVWANSSG